jgi:ribose 5-phosphate isomerase A
VKPKSPSWLEQAKRAAAREAVKEVKDGYIIGLGSGTTAAHAIEELGKNIKKKGIQVLVVPSSHQAFLLAAQNEVQVTSLDEHQKLDMTIDGADQVERNTLNMIKGMGGALTREKIVASASKRLVIIVDETKLTEKLGSNQPIPVEVLPFALAPVSARLRALKGKPTLREGNGKVGPVVTDNGNFILDVDFKAIRDPENLNTQIKAVPGVVETGLFLNMATVVYVGKRDTVQKLTRE